MDKESTPKIYGVLGFPAKHSLSPAMHNAAFRALHINAEYQIFEVKPEELNDFLQSLSEKDILRYCSKNLEDFMVPKFVELVETLPKTESGKIKKVGLK